MTSSPFKAAIMKASRTDSLDTTLAYVLQSGFKRDPSATNRAFLWRVPAFTENIKWHLMKDRPTGFSASSDWISNAT